MKTGISSACFYPEVNTEDTVHICRSLGLDLMEFFLESLSELEPEYCTKLKETCDLNGIMVHSVHAFSSSFEPFLFDEYKRRREDMMKIFRSVCRAGAALDAKYYVFHGIRRMGEEQAVDFRKIANGMDYLVETAGEAGISLAWENVSWCQSGSPSFLYNVMQYIKSDKIRFTLDLKQARKCGHEPSEYIDVMKDKIVNVHINDYDSKNNCLLPGYGSADLKGVYKKLLEYGYDGPFIIEVYRKNFSGYDEITTSIDYIMKKML